MSLVQNTKISPPFTYHPNALVGLFVRGIPHIYSVENITGGNIYNFGRNPGSLDIALKHRMPLSKNQCTDVWLYILCLVENYTNGVMFNYHPEDCVRNRPFIHCSMACPRHRGSLPQEVSVSLFRSRTVQSVVSRYTD